MKFLLLLFTALVILATPLLAEDTEEASSFHSNPLIEANTPFSSNIQMNEGATTYEVLSSTSESASDFVTEDVLGRYSNHEVDSTGNLDFQGETNFGPDAYRPPTANSIENYDPYMVIRSLRDATSFNSSQQPLDPEFSTRSAYKPYDLPVLGVYQNLSNLMTEKFYLAP